MNIKDLQKNLGLIPTNSNGETTVTNKDNNISTNPQIGINLNTNNSNNMRDSMSPSMSLSMLNNAYNNSYNNTPRSFGESITNVITTNHADLQDKADLINQGVIVNRVNTREELLRERATNQRWYEQAAKAVGQAVVNEIVLGGVKAFSDIADFLINVGHEAGENDYTNPLSTYLENLQDDLRKKWAIYRENPDENFALGDFGWWADNAVSIATTASLFLPQFMTFKGLNLASKLIKATKWGRAVNQGLGTFGKWVSRSNMSAARVANNMENFVNVGLASVVSRTAENYIEGREVYKEVYEDTKNKLANMTDKDREILYIRNPELVGKTDEEIAKYIAGVSADETFKMDYAMLAFDVFQFKTIGRLFKFSPNKTVTKGLRAFNTKTIKELAEQGANATARAASKTAGKTAAATAENAASATTKAATKSVTKSGVKNWAKKRYTNIKNGISDFFRHPFNNGLVAEWTEGVEEGYQGIMSEKGKEVAEMMLDPSYDAKDIWSYLQDASIWEQAVWGALGGWGYKHIGNGIGKLGDKISLYKDYITGKITKEEYSLGLLSEEKIRTAEIQNRLAYNKKLVEDINLINQGLSPTEFETNKETGEVIVVNGVKQRKKLTKDEMEAAKLEAIREWTVQATTAAIDAGNYDLLKEYMTSEELDKYFKDSGLETTIGGKKIKERILEDMESIANDYAKAVEDIYFNTNVDNEHVARGSARNIVRLKHLSTLYRDDIDFIDNEINKLKNDSNAVAIENRKLKETINEIRARLADINSQEQKILTNKNISIQAKEKYKRDFRKSRLAAIRLLRESGMITDVDVNKLLDAQYKELDKILKDGNGEIDRITSEIDNILNNYFQSIKDEQLDYELSSMIHTRAQLRYNKARADELVPKSKEDYQEIYSDMEFNISKRASDKYNGAARKVEEWLQKQDDLDKAYDDLINNRVRSLKNELDILKLGHESTRAFTVSILATIRQEKQKRQKAKEDANKVNNNGTTETGKAAETTKKRIEEVVNKGQGKSDNAGKPSTGDGEQASNNGIQQQLKDDTDSEAVDAAQFAKETEELREAAKQSGKEQAEAQNGSFTNEQISISRAFEITVGMYKTNSDLFVNLLNKEFNSPEVQEVVDIIAKELESKGVSPEISRVAAKQGLRMALKVIKRKNNKTGTKESRELREATEEVATKQKLDEESVKKAEEEAKKESKNDTIITKTTTNINDVTSQHVSAVIYKDGKRVGNVIILDFGTFMINYNDGESSFTYTIGGQNSTTAEKLFKKVTNEGLTYEYNIIGNVHIGDKVTIINKTGDTITGTVFRVGVHQVDVKISDGSSYINPIYAIKDIINHTTQQDNTVDNTQDNTETHTQQNPITLNAYTPTISDIELNETINKAIEKYLNYKGVDTSSGKKITINLERFFYDLMNDPDVGITANEALIILRNMQEYITSNGNNKYKFTSKINLKEILANPVEFINAVKNLKTDEVQISTNMHISASSRRTTAYEKMLDKLKGGEELIAEITPTENGRESRSISFKINTDAGFIELGYLSFVTPTKDNTGFSVYINPQTGGIEYSVSITRDGKYVSNMDEVFDEIFNKETGLFDIIEKIHTSRLEGKDWLSQFPQQEREAILDKILNNEAIKKAIENGVIKIRKEYDVVNKKYKTGTRQQQVDFILDKLEGIIFYDMTCNSMDDYKSSYESWKQKAYINYSNTYKLQTALKNNKRVKVKLSGLGNRYGINGPVIQPIINEEETNISDLKLDVDKNPIIVVSRDADGNTFLINEKTGEKVANTSPFVEGTMGMYIGGKSSSPILALFTSENHLSEQLSRNLKGELTNILESFASGKMDFEEVKNRFIALFGSATSGVHTIFKGYKVIVTEKNIALATADSSRENPKFVLVISKYKHNTTEIGTGITYAQNGNKELARSTIKGSKKLISAAVNEIVGNITYNKTFFTINNRGADTSKSLTDSTGNPYMYKENGKFVIKINGSEQKYDSFGDFALKERAFNTTQGQNENGGFFDNATKAQSLYVDISVLEPANETSPVEGQDVFKIITNDEQEKGTGEILQAAGVPQEQINVLTGQTTDGIELVPLKVGYDRKLNRDDNGKFTSGARVLAVTRKGKVYFSREGAKAAANSNSTLIRLLIHEQLHKQIASKSLFEREHLTDELIKIYEYAIEAAKEIVNDKSINKNDGKYLLAKAFLDWIKKAHFDINGYFENANSKDKEYYKNLSNEEKRRIFAEEWLVESLSQSPIIKLLNAVEYKDEEINVEGITETKKSIWQKIIDLLLKVFGKSNTRIHNNTILAKQYTILGDLNINDNTPINNTEETTDNESSPQDYESGEEFRPLGIDEDFDFGGGIGDDMFAVTPTAEDVDIDVDVDNIDSNGSTIASPLGIQSITNMNDFINMFDEQYKPIIAQMTRNGEIRYVCR